MKSTPRAIKPITTGPAIAIRLELLDGLGSSGKMNVVLVGVARLGDGVFVGWIVGVIVAVAWGVGVASCIGVIAVLGTSNCLLENNSSRC